MADNNLDSILYAVNNKVAMVKDIPALNLIIGNYGDVEMEATLDINSRDITNPQIIIAGVTGGFLIDLTATTLLLKVTLFVILIRLKIQKLQLSL